jgi:hypothetical protein
VTNRETDGQTERQTDKQRDRRTNRETDGQTERQTDKQRDKHTDGDENRQRDRHTVRQTNGQIDRQADGHVERQADGQKDKQTKKRQTDKQTHRETDNQMDGGHTLILSRPPLFWEPTHKPVPCNLIGNQMADNRLGLMVIQPAGVWSFGRQTFDRQTFDQQTIGKHKFDRLFGLLTTNLSGRPVDCRPNYLVIAVSMKLCFGQMSVNQMAFDQKTQNLIQKLFIQIVIRVPYLQKA